MHPDHEINRASWDELAATHGQDAYYDTTALIAGASSLIEEEESALALAIDRDLAGLRVLHLQCHIGFDAITFARRGARVTGVDFSTVALAKAASIADRAGVEVEWVCADATALPPSLGRAFDLVWATVGVLCWIADLQAWMRAVAGTLVPGGRLVLIDGASARKVAGSGRRVIESGWDYATSLRTGPQVQYARTVEEIAAAAGEAGLRVLSLREHTDLSDDLRVDHVEREADGRWRRRIDGLAVPLLFTLIATS